MPLTDHGRLVVLSPGEAGAEGELVLLDEVKAQLGVVGPSEDSRLRVLISAVGRTFAGPRGLNRALGEGRYREHWSPAWSTRALLAHWPVLEILSVRRGGEARDLAEVEIAGKRRSDVWVSGSLARGVEPMEIEYRAGWRLPRTPDDGAFHVDLPEDIHQAALVTVCEWYRGALEIPVGVVEERGEGGMTRFAGEITSPLPPVARAVLEAYR